MKLLKRIANLGYGSRSQVSALFRHGLITDAVGDVLYADDVIDPAQVRVEGEPLDPPPGLLLMLNKPAGFTCSHKDHGRLIYDLLPPRYRLRNPALSSVGRLDRDTSGLLLLTDDGQLLHRIVAPRSKLSKVYEVTLAADLRGDEAALFASGSLLLESEQTPLLPAELEVVGPRQVRLTLHEGRYHQVRRMFAAVGNHVEALHRSCMGGLDLGTLAVGEWRFCGEAAKARLFGRGDQLASGAESAQPGGEVSAS
jgi:16S rRNA pseudouridine516 synthase